MYDRMGVRGAEGMKLERATKTGSKYQSPVPTKLGGLGLILKVLPRYLRNKNETVPTQPLGPFHTDAAIYRTLPVSGLRVTWFGHSSFLLEVDGVTLLVDPVWDERAAPVRWAGPRRFFAAPLALADLPPLDAILLTHDHYDHLGERTCRYLAQARPGLRWIVPLGVGKVLARFGVSEELVTELDWTGSTTVLGQQPSAALRITALPARHFSGRGLLNRNETLWAAFALRGSTHSIFHGADSGLWGGFASIGEQYGPFDLVLLEIGAFDPLWKDIHLGPDGAAAAFKELVGRDRGALLMPIHWGLFDLALHGWRDPIERLTEVAADQQIRLFAPEPGAPTEVNGEQVRSTWWDRTE